MNAKETVKEVRLYRPNGESRLVLIRVLPPIPQKKEPQYAMRKG
jgi:hypothetical protein